MKSLIMKNSGIRRQISFMCRILYSGGSRGGGVQGVRTPPFGPRCRLFNIGPKVGPPLGPPPFLLVDLRWTPVADPGCVCDRGACECPRMGVFFNFSQGG